jgi:hypothetical protein
MHAHMAGDAHSIRAAPGIGQQLRVVAGGVQPPATVEEANRLPTRLPQPLDTRTLPRRMPAACMPLTMGVAKAATPSLTAPGMQLMHTARTDAGDKALLLQRITLLEAQLAEQCADSGQAAHTAYNLQVRPPPACMEGVLDADSPRSTRSVAASASHSMSILQWPAHTPASSLVAWLASGGASAAHARCPACRVRARTRARCSANPPQLKLANANNKIKAIEHAHHKELTAAHAAIAGQQHEIEHLRRSLAAAEAAARTADQLRLVTSQVWGTCAATAAQ